MEKGWGDTEGVDVNVERDLITKDKLQERGGEREGVKRIKRMKRLRVLE